MSSLNRRYRTDQNKEVDGITIEYTDMDGNVQAWFKCRRPGGRNVDFNKALNRRLREHRKELQVLQDNPDDPKAQHVVTRAYAEAYADAVILDWGGDIEGPHGVNPVPCTFDNIVWLFSVDCPDLFEDLQNQLSRRSRWQPEDKEAASKNSKAASNTN